ncbi:MAG: hypothetical protein UZ11_BCD004002025 [Bacteroidetes bacterium OLB11]|nr:MAG: hypothetical protein UZ11_BCD004002025 [Bacteroidetes bacterium OLB11]
MSLEKRNPINIQNETKIKIYNKSKRITKDVFFNCNWYFFSHIRTEGLFY